jgi:hypothetical protein
MKPALDRTRAAASTWLPGSKARGRSCGEEGAAPCRRAEPAGQCHRAPGWPGPAARPLHVAFRREMRPNEQRTRAGMLTGLGQVLANGRDHSALGQSPPQIAGRYITDAFEYLNGSQSAQPFAAIQVVEECLQAPPGFQG